MLTFIGEHGELFDESTTLRVFYDGGQKGVSHILILWGQTPKTENER